MPFLNRLLYALPGVERLQLTMNQANLKYTLGFFILLSLTLALAAYTLCSALTGNAALSLVAATVSASLPLLYVRTKKNQRMAKFEKQFPEALGLVARALRAGHAFASGMNSLRKSLRTPSVPNSRKPWTRSTSG